MTNTHPGDLPVGKSIDDFEEKTACEGRNLETSELDNLSTTGSAQNKESKYNGSNLVKQICWFYVNNNCRYGRNCRFSHVRSDSSAEYGQRNFRREDYKVSNPKSRSLNENINSKRSFNSEREGEVKVQTQLEKHNSIASRRFDTSAHSEKNPSRSNVQTSQGPRVNVRQRNLYFYRSGNRGTSSHSPKNETQSPKLCRYFSKGFCRQGDSCKFLHQANDRSDATEENIAESVKQTSVSGKEKGVTETCSEPRLQNYRSVPTTRRTVQLHDMSQDDNQRLRETEIQQLKKRFPAHELIKSCPEEIFHVIFSPSDPDWSFAVSSVSLEIAFSNEYPREAFAIKVQEADNMPTLLVWHLNKSVSEWIKEKHQTCVESGKVELLFRPFLRWFDRNLEHLFIVGLRKVKQDLLAKEAGIEFIPCEELPGASVKTGTATSAMCSTECNKSGDCSSSQIPHDIGSAEKTEQSSKSENLECEQHQGHDTIREREVSITPGEEKNYLLTNAEKENFSPDLLAMKYSLSKESELLLPANPSFDKFNIPKTGTEVKLLGLELKENAAAMVCNKISATLQCSRCKTRHEISTPARRKNSLNCIKCHQSMQIVFQPAILHQFSAILGYLHLVDCQAVDIPLMECNFTVDCLNCSKQICINGIHYGQQRVTWCQYCNNKLCIYTQSVKFHLLQPSSVIASPGHKFTIPTKKEKKVIKDPAIQEGKPLPDCGTCKHYKKSYRWLRFPCCGKTYPCDVCHNEREFDHEMKYANRMICGFCATEQPYAGEKPCVSCSSNMTKKAGPHWEGGKGCRDKITMSREDRQKYAGMSKTTSKKAQSQKPSKK